MITLPADEFPLAASTCYLNHAGVGPWPQRTHLAITQFSEENITTGAQYYPRWLRVEKQLKQRLQTLINAPSIDDIALVKNTSEGLSMVAYGLDWQSGDNVVISNHEFPSNRIVWESLASLGVNVKTAVLEHADTPEQAVIEAIDENTRMVSISSVHYASGLKMDCVALGQACRERDVLFCVDTIQSVGAHVFDVQAYQADFAIADGHKWMLGPEGLGFFYSRPQARDQLKLTQFGWHMVEDHGNYDTLDWQPAASARRFECGSPNMLGVHALNASMSLFEEVGMENVEAALQKNIDYLIDGLSGLPGIDIISPTTPSRRAGIVTFKSQNQDSKALHGTLMQHGIVCAYRGGGVRLTPHFYTPVEKLGQALDTIAEQTKG